MVIDIAGHTRANSMRESNVRLKGYPSEVYQEKCGTYLAPPP
jgi:hypothetical protein